MCNDYTTQYARYVSLLIIIVVASPHHQYHSLLLILCRFIFFVALSIVGVPLIRNMRAGQCMRRSQGKRLLRKLCKQRE